eukprot:TRINITY_DN34325_c0_g1_i1.p1 TRINITY_DN34325_c0_g1~~TRINITY_DN34325_c0_g1_i1.p1  ORF type:complete len:826 (-),score=91.80 TRINITY_DN34325_c0_g1_i1:187-2664(-)
MTKFVRMCLVLAVGLAKLMLVGYSCLWAYRLRLDPVETYGYIIHEFDPWFNFRATEYLALNGWDKFFHWFDYMSWYPLGRPVGTTIYPGMQIASVSIWKFMQSMPAWSASILPKACMERLPKLIQDVLPSFLPGRGQLRVGPMSLNDVCCMVPAWFGSLATLFVALLAAEVSNSTGAGVAAAFVMACIPAHLSRSLAGGYDNESVAVSAICCTFWLWCRSLRTRNSWPVGFFTGVAYACAASTWGGYIFVNNMIGVHAALLVVLGKYNTSLYRAYCLWYVVGTAGATYVPIIGLTPLRSMEQAGSLLVFFIFQFLEFCDVYRQRTIGGMGAWRFFLFRAMVFTFAFLTGGVVVWSLIQYNYFAPWTARIRALFIDHQSTGNPLVDSVAEHMASDEQVYQDHLHKARYLAVVGLAFCFHPRTPAKIFPLIYAAVAYHFSWRMSRLIIICGPIVSLLAGLPVGIVGDWCIEQCLGLIHRAPASCEYNQGSPSQRTGGMGSIIRFLWAWWEPVVIPREVSDLAELLAKLSSRVPIVDRLFRVALAFGVVVIARRYWIVHVKDFVDHCESMVPMMSDPTLVWHDEEGDLIDDYVVGYKWLASNTPEDARVMAWWDYGYHITGIGNRTSLADGNTWNHEHIATLGRTLTSPEKGAWNVMRHLADYVLVWAGDDDGDLAKSPHLARIGNSVYPDMCGEDDPTCSKFGFIDDDLTPTPMMGASFLYRAVMHGKSGVRLNPKLFREVYTSKHGFLRIFKILNVSVESKAWCADPTNRICDAPGSWYCAGQFPPALQPLLAKRRNFAQLEDFNKQGQEKSAYTNLMERTRNGEA